jgi:hypothetical protein
MLMQSHFANAARKKAVAIEDVFTPKVWIGDGTGSRSFDIGFAPDLIMIAQEGASVQIVDSVRGATHYLNAGNNAIDATPSLVASIDASGFTVLTGSNASGSTYLALCFKKQAKFFDLFSYTGNGANRTIAHSLGLAAALALIKNYSGTAQLFSMESIGGGVNNVYQIGSATAVNDATIFNSALPSASVLSLGTSGRCNNSGSNHMCYLWAHNTAADSLVYGGSFTTDGSGNATVTGLPFQPGCVFWRTTALSPGAGWLILNKVNGWGAGADQTRSWDTFFPSSVDRGAPTSNGFTVTGLTASTTYMYLAIKDGAYR